jgi:hypothetical protein
MSTINAAIAMYSSMVAAIKRGAALLTLENNLI